jgi:CHAD domain-containing protein
MALANGIRVPEPYSGHSLRNQMKSLSRRLEKKRQRLLQDYDAEHLHALRITLRRMRSRLKQIPGKEARHLRRDLSVLAGATNAARDWDTLVKSAGNLLPEEQFQQLAPWLEAEQKSARDRVTQMLQSEKWASALKQWRHQEKEHHQLREETAGYAKHDLSRTLQELITARDKALSRDDDKRWHKLRIAIKDLRYQLDATPKKKRSGGDRKILALCKQLQVDLGEWHDTVVHAQLLDKIAFAGDPTRRAPPRDALESLQRAIAQRGSAQIQQARSRLGQAEVLSVLMPPAEGV